MYYISTDFDFSDRARQWILDQFHDRFSTKFLHDLDVSQFYAGQQEKWHQSPAGTEILEFLSHWGLDSSLYGIGAFISNADKFFMGNPHVDTGYTTNMERFEIRSRFNVMVLGNPQDTMFWWKDLCYDDARLERKSFWDLDGRHYIGSAIPGENPADRWNYLGTPSVSAAGILTPSGFVRTNCAHTVHVSPGPRLLITVALDQDIDLLQVPKKS